MIDFSGADAATLDVVAADDAPLDLRLGGLTVMLDSGGSGSSGHWWLAPV